MVLSWFIPEKLRKVTKNTPIYKPTSEFLPYTNVSKFYSMKNLFKLFTILRNAFRSGRPLYFRIPIAGHISRDISREIWIFSRCFRVYPHLLQCFWQNPLNLVRKHCPRLSKNEATVVINIPSYSSVSIRR